jgi:hypothetical protein
VDIKHLNQEPLARGPPVRPRDPRALWGGEGEPGPQGPPAHDRSRGQRPSRRQDHGRARRAGQYVVDVRQPRHPVGPPHRREGARPSPGLQPRPVRPSCRRFSPSRPFPGTEHVTALLTPPQPGTETGPGDYSSASASRSTWPGSVEVGK